MKKLIVFIVLSSVLSACVTSKKGHSFFNTLSNSELAIENNSKFIDAISFKNSGSYEKAIVLLNEIIKSRGDKAPAHFELAKIYKFKSENSKSLSHINFAVELNPKNKWYINYKIELTSQFSLYLECEKTYQLRQKIFPENTDYDLEFTDFYISNKKYRAALKLYNKIEEVLGVSHEVNFNKFLIYRGLGEYDNCETEINKLINIFPAKSIYYIQYADFKLEHGENDSALKIYNKALSVTPEEPYILNELARYNLQHDKENIAFELYEKVVKDPSFQVSEKRQIIKKFQRLAEVNEKNYNFLRKLIFLAAKVHPYEPSINIMAGDLAFDERSFKEAVAYYQKVVDVKLNNYNAWIQLVIGYYNFSNYDKMLEKTQEALELFPAQPSFYFYNGMAKIHNKQYNEAIEILEEGNDLVLGSSKSLKAQFLSSLGDAYHAIDNNEKSDEYFELSLELEPENYYILNNYAYYLSERNSFLEKAKKMSQLSNQLNPNEASFQDTYGWILFQLGENELALDWLLKSTLNGGKDSAVVNEHIGDVYQKLGKLVQARKYWELSNEIGGGSSKLPNKLKL